MSQSHNKPSNALFLFFIQPFLGFLVSLKYINSKVGKFVFIAFATLWGYAQSFTHTPTDGYRVAASFCQQPIRDFSTIIYMFEQGLAIDGYLLVSNFFVHQFSDNAKVYFAFLGFVFGLFCYKSLSFLVKERVGNHNRFLSHLLFLLFATNSFAWLTAPRFFTTTWIATYIFVCIMQGKKRYALFSVVLPLIHFSFLPVAVALFLMPLLSKFFSKHLKILFYGVCVMFMLSFVLPKSVIARMMPQELMEENSKFASKASYVNDSNKVKVVKEVSAYREANSFVKKTFNLLMKAGSFLALLFFYLRRKTICNDRKVFTTYVSVLIVAFVAYFMSIIPGSGWRYINVLWLLLYILFYRYCDVFRPKQFGKILLPLYTMNIYTISFMFYVTYQTVDLVLFYAPMPFVITHGIGFPPVYFV